MAATVLCIFRFVRLLLSAHQAVAHENAALRMQIAAYPREKSRPKVWSNWHRPLLYVQPDTVVRWRTVS